MSDKPISPLRQRMIDDMTARRFAQQQISAGSINAAIAALRFFFTVTLESMRPAV